MILGVVLTACLAAAIPNQFPSRFPQSFPLSPSQMKTESPPSPVVPQRRPMTNDDVETVLQDPTNFGPPPSLQDIIKRRETLERERAASATPGMGRSQSRLAQWLPETDTPREKAKAQLDKVKEEMKALFGQGVDYAKSITQLGDAAIETELVPHQHARRELNFMNGIGHNEEFFDTDFNHPIDSAAIQQGLNALKNSRDQHQAWADEKSPPSKVGAPTSQRQQQPQPPSLPPQPIIPNFRNFATRAHNAAEASSVALGGGVITKSTLHSP
eukprot:c22261_g1_i1.p1 GENE.c22261_g1_i1~~c22261_g1_i1.p1  ORF type:complete len:271 (-),score=37.27 c22261_g1_i1:79-891(-)